MPKQPLRTAAATARPAGVSARPPRGFTLIELMVSLAILGILVKIAIPAYSQYVLRGQLVNATNGLNAAAAQMEQYFQDNRQYTATGTATPPCLTPSLVGQFMISCVAPGGPVAGMPGIGPGATTYTLMAQGGFSTAGVYSAALPTAGFYYTLDYTGTKWSMAGAVWAGATCAGWMLKDGVCS